VVANPMTVGMEMGLRFRVYRPPAPVPGERLPLLVMLHGCGQDGQELAASTAMNRIAARKRFVVLYPEQSSLNAHRCWHWYDTRTGRAQREAFAIDAVISQVCREQGVDPERIAVAGLSAGAGMAALLATLIPERFRAVVMHSGIVPGVADSLVSALRAMSGARVGAGAHAPAPALPALLVIHGDQDRIVHLDNAGEAVHWWATQGGAGPGLPRREQRGGRYPVTVTEYRAQGSICAILCQVHGLGHAWSGGTGGRDFSDPQGPDASRMIWAFAALQFAVTKETGAKVATFGMV
jgi:poly(hydroxyalkanoate) depolymerase family esterase